MIKIKKRFRFNTDAQINIVPYIDVMLVLLVIFMTTTQIIYKIIDVELPSVRGGTTDDITNEGLYNKGVHYYIITVDKLGEYYISKVGEPAEEKSQTLDTIVARVRLALDTYSKDRVKVSIRGDKKVVYDKVVQLIFGLSDYGINNVGLYIDPVDESNDQ